MTNGNGHGATVILRWIAGLIILVQAGVLGWMSSRIDELDDRVDQVSLLNERMNNMVPIATYNRDKVIEMDKELSNMRQVDANQDKRLDRIEGRLR